MTVDVAEQVGDDAMVGLVLDVLEQDRAPAVHVFLQPGDLEVGVDLLVRLDQVALRLEPRERAAQVANLGQKWACSILSVMGAPRDGFICIDC